MKKRTIKAGQFQRHYATNGILMYRERKNLIDVPEGTMVTVLKARRQSHLCSVRCIEQDGKLILGNGKRAVEVCIAIETEFMPKLKIEGAATTTAKSTTKKGSKKVKTVAAEAVVANDQPAGVGPADLQPAVAEQPAEQAAPQAVVEAPAAPAEQPAIEAAPAAEAAV